MPNPTATGPSTLPENTEGTGQFAVYHLAIEAPDSYDYYGDLPATGPLIYQGGRGLLFYPTQDLTALTYQELKEYYKEINCEYLTQMMKSYKLPDSRMMRT